MLKIAAARKELLEKSLLDIERATAKTWGSRAAACYQLAAEAKQEKSRSIRMHEAATYRGEAIEHAAMTEDLKFVRDLLGALKPHQAKAESKTRRKAVG